MLYSLLLTMVGILAASVLRGFTGFGFGLAAVPLLSLVLPPAEVVPLVVTLQIVVGLGGIREAVHLCDWSSVRRLVPGLILGVPFGIMILTLLPPNPVRLLIGAMIVVSVILLHRGARLPPEPSRLLTAAVGLLAGVITGFSSMGGPPIIVYLMARGHSPQRIRATAIVYFMIAGCATGLPMVFRGLITHHTVIWAAACLPVLFFGTWTGTLAFRRAQPRHHRLTALITLTTLAALLIVRTVLSMLGA